MNFFCATDAGSGEDGSVTRLLLEHGLQSFQVQPLHAGDDLCKKCETLYDPNIAFCKQTKLCDVGTFTLLTL